MATANRETRRKAARAVSKNGAKHGAVVKMPEPMQRRVTMRALIGEQSTRVVFCKPCGHEQAMTLVAGSDVTFEHDYLLIPSPSGMIVHEQCHACAEQTAQAAPAEPTPVEIESAKE